MSILIIFLIAVIPISCNNTNLSVQQSSPEWLPEALQDIAYYLRAHKFKEYDRRYEPDAKSARREYFAGFPRPPLRSLHWEVHKNCEESFLECVNYLRKKVRQAGIKRGDDTVTVIKEQKWNMQMNAQQIEIVNEECKKMQRADDVQANPFEGPLERFQWRTTASYYMCWYTQLSEPSLKHLLDVCDNFSDCLDPALGPNNKDTRANNTIPYSCALYSFCPNPCCPFKHLTKLENCWNTPDNPCFEANPLGQRECVVNRSLNTDFSNVILNRWNVSCSCPDKGFEWNSFYGICIDIDECALGSHICDHSNQVCLNLPGTYRCACRWGYNYDSHSKKCIQSPAVTQIFLQKETAELNMTQKTWWLRIRDQISFLNNSAAKRTLMNQIKHLVLIFIVATFCKKVY